MMNSSNQETTQESRKICFLNLEQASVSEF